MRYLDSKNKFYAHLVEILKICTYPIKFHALFVLYVIGSFLPITSPLPLVYAY